MGLLLMGYYVADSYKHNLFTESEVGTIVTMFICCHCLFIRYQLGSVALVMSEY